MIMNNQGIIVKVIYKVRQKLEGEGSGHDWWHVYRVWKMAQHIGKEENANMFVVELAALLHDIADWKSHGGNDTVGPRVARQILSEHGVSEDVINHVCEIISTMDFKGAGVKSEMKTLEGKVVQDADRLDAIGAIGIARTFAYGGHKGRSMYEPEQKLGVQLPFMHQTKEDYFRNESPTINHFYEKLLLLKDRMNTEAAKKLAEGRHQFMKEYLDRFFREWEGEI